MYTVLIISDQVDLQSFVKHVILTSHQILIKVTHVIKEIPLVLRIQQKNNYISGRI